MGLLNTIYRFTILCNTLNQYNKWLADIQSEGILNQIFYYSKYLKVLVSLALGTYIPYNTRDIRM